jgi:WD40 repeat protein
MTSPTWFRLVLISVVLMATRGNAETTLKAHKKGVNSVAVSRDGVIGSAGDEGVVIIWKASSPVATRPAGDKAGPIHTIAFSPDGKLVALGTMYGQVAIWNHTTGMDVFAIKGHDGRITQAGFLPDGKTLVTVSIDKTARLWDVETGKEKAKLVGPKYAFRALAFAADGKTLFSCDTNGGVTSWSLATNKPIATHPASKGACHALALSPNGKELAAGFGDGTVVVLDPGTGKELRRVKAAASINSLAYASSGRIVAGTQSSELAIIDPSGAVTQRKGHDRPITAVAATPDGVVSGSMDMTVRLWN